MGRRTKRLSKYKKHAKGEYSDASKQITSGGVTMREKETAESSL